MSAADEPPPDSADPAAQALAATLRVRRHKAALRQTLLDEEIAPTGMIRHDSVVRAAVAAVVIDDEGRLLAGRRIGPSGDGRLALPGGSIEPGESLAAAVQREVLEETGLRVRCLAYSQVQPELFVVNHADATGHFLVVFLECRLTGGTLCNREPDRCAGWSWLTFGDLVAAMPADAVAAWRAGTPHECLDWIPLPQFAYYRDHLGLVDSAPTRRIPR